MGEYVEPSYMSHLLAKSANMGGQTLARHTWDVLERLRDQTHLHPELTQLMGERLWTRMYWGCFFHDFGKAATGFQNILTSHLDEHGYQWREHGQRHEILSLAFVDWLFPKGHQDREWVIGVIAFHHKDAYDIFFKYGGKQPYNQLPEETRQDYEYLLDHLTNQINSETRLCLWQWTQDCGVAWAEKLEYPPIDIPERISQDMPQNDLFQSIYKALLNFAQWEKNLAEHQKQIAILYRGLILTSDHAASAGIGKFPEMPLDTVKAEKPFKANNRTKRSHQEKAAQQNEGSCILIAPTGSGKTEAALLWAAQQREQRASSRLFYVLPYQASMNAMEKRIKRDYFGDQLEEVEDLVAVQHSRALLKFYQDAMQADEDPKAAERLAREKQNRVRLNSYPIQIFSPYQMLKAAYSLKGYETLLVDYTNALFIFDEIHAYEPKRMALIITFMGWLSRHCHARFFIMTATLPPMIKQHLQHELGNLSEIVADDSEFDRSRRHTVHILQGCLRDSIVNYVRKDIQDGKNILICCNRVGDAQWVYDILHTELGEPKRDILLFHSRFNGQDRAEKERLLAEKVGVRNTTPKSKGFVLVATQVVEVSLDIDLDTIYTDPAPLEALLQRFGRVNRGRHYPDGKNQLCPVHVFREPFQHEDEKDTYLPYDAQLVEKSIGVLDKFCGGTTSHNQGEIDEKKVEVMLGEIYSDETILQQWERDFKETSDEFRKVILGFIKPYQSADLGIWENFYKLFEGIEVLPNSLYDKYKKARKTSYLEALQYLVPLSLKYWQIKKLKETRKLWEEDEVYLIDDTNNPYNPQTGLNLDGI